MTTVEIPGVDLTALAGWMDAQGLGGGPLSDTELISGGTQNILLRFRRAGREYVLRRPPIHKRPNSDETMRREARVLAALGDSAVPHPGLVAACPDTDVIGAAFYLMEPVAGLNPTVTWPECYRADPGLQHRLGLAMAAGIAELAGVDIDAAGLRTLGRADGWLERQVQRWRSQLEGYAATPGYPGALLPGMTEVAGWLEEHRPVKWSPGLIHGDFHFANVLITPDSGELAAIVDWELTTIGDPLLDLGHLLATWPTHYPVGGGLDAPHLPATGEIIERYTQLSGRTVENTDWYRVLACYRLGVLVEGTNARAYAGLATSEAGERLHYRAVLLFEQALSVISGPHH